MSSVAERSEVAVFSSLRGYINDMEILRLVVL